MSHAPHIPSTSADDAADACPDSAAEAAAKELAAADVDLWRAELESFRAKVQHDIEDILTILTHIAAQGTEEDADRGKWAPSIGKDDASTDDSRIRPDLHTGNTRQSDVKDERFSALKARLSRQLTTSFGHVPTDSDPGACQSAVVEDLEVPSP